MAGLDAEHYQRFADALPDIAFVADTAGGLRYLNAAGVEFLGVRADELEDGDWSRLVHPDDIPGAWASFERSLASASRFEVEVRARRADGAYRWLLARVRIIRGDGGAPEALVGTATDIEQLRRAEATAREAERHTAELAAVLDTLQREAPIGFGLVDTEFRFLRINDALAEINGLAPDAHIGLTVSEVVPDLWPSLRPLYERVRREGTPVLETEVEGETAARPGDRRSWNVSYFPVRSDGKPIGIGIVVVETTEARDLEAELRARLEQQAALAELGRIAVRSRAPAETMRAAVAMLRETLGVEFAELLQLQPGGDELLLIEGEGWREGAVGTVRESAEHGSQAGYTMTVDEPVVVADLRAETRFGGPSLLFEHGVSSGMTVVIPVRGAPWGVLGAHTTGSRRFVSHDTDFLRSVAHLVGAAVETAAAEEELRLNRTVLDGMAEGVLVWRFAGPGLDGRIEYANPQTERLLGYERGELAGRAPGSLSGEAPQERERLVESVRTELARSGRWRGDLRLRTKQGEIRLHETNIALLRAGEEGTLAVAVTHDITETREIEGARARAEAQRRDLLNELVTAQESERRRIAAGIHDDSLQALSAIRLRLGDLREDLGPERGDGLDELDADLRQAIGGLRDLLFRLRPPVLVEAGLEAALRGLLDELGEGRAATARLGGGLATEPSLEVRTIAYRIAREALLNAHRHAQASLIEVTLADADGSIALRIRDDGVGFHPASEIGRPGHLGLTTMRERAELAGGWLHVSSAPGDGTTVEFAIPRESGS